MVVITAQKQRLARSPPYLLKVHPFFEDGHTTRVCFTPESVSVLYEPDLAPYTLQLENPGSNTMVYLPDMDIGYLTLVTVPIN